MLSCHKLSCLIGGESTILLISETVCPKHRAERRRLCARDRAMSLTHEIVPFHHRIPGALSLLSPKIIYFLRRRSKRGRPNCISLSMKPRIAIPALPFGGNGDSWNAGGINILPLCSEFRHEFRYENCHDYFFLFSSLKVAARLEGCLPSFPPGGKSCD